MNIQKSYEDTEEQGRLYLVGTPIGNLEDITYRAIRTLQKSDLIAAEDTRHTLKLLNHFEIHKPLVSYHEHNKGQRGAELIDLLLQGKNIALVSDAGMPAISDPGYELVVEAIKNGVTVIPIPGPNAAITAIIASGLSTERFLFLGFLPREKKELHRELENYQFSLETLILYEAPHRIEKTLKAIREILGNRKIVLIRELTKKHEEFIRGELDEVIPYVEKNIIKGELTLIIEGARKEIIQQLGENWWNPLTIVEHVTHYLEQGLTVKEAIKQTSIDRNLAKREVYQAYHIENEEKK
ncbi:16S rRNA (cytidine1402-2'-O)-methyltransferase [Tepidibacillus fermentans]|uniref:Ribosomal RNA small subunit methyltransferase I n=1 Tax=Tepidibacillus fermentans TaxID=1281767 RepID=A0A4R3K5G2_9BACI|nr:16S rRNA (cytidine(1402)-2'-O)-methyltransferase [Tepidibacillus fermentans]TCS77960.1 16S rRNA (cytidine1402-2'-O)-methyltransferase [Tepidibacillus fermentans]